MRNRYIINCEILRKLISAELNNTCDVLIFLVYNNLDFAKKSFKSNKNRRHLTLFAITGHASLDRIYYYHDPFSQELATKTPNKFIVQTQLSFTNDIRMSFGQQINSSDCVVRVLRHVKMCSLNVPLNELNCKLNEINSNQLKTSDNELNKTNCVLYEQYNDINEINDIINGSNNQQKCLPLNLYKCDVNDCNKLFRHKSSLSQHKRIHFDEKLFKCDVISCYKCFTSKRYLNQHKIVHSMEKPFKCDVDNCNQLFRHKSSLSQHKRIHFDEKRFKCDVNNCNKIFATKRHLSQHIVKHSDEKPFKCDANDCNKLFSHKSSLIKHKHKHLDEKSINCDDNERYKKFEIIDANEDKLIYYGDRHLKYHN
ncbi:zinc finger protein 813-like [Oppia nitens]|uniref:zinc finger protein 813-like n=1 Tax=Oppia nitens TaxID=1686743 RepID=UPI0023D97D2B|nr:zinc finger protein 813-like [Oppia nitens]